MRHAITQTLSPSSFTMMKPTAVALLSILSLTQAFSPSPLGAVTGRSGTSSTSLAAAVSPLFAAKAARKKNKSVSISIPNPLKKLPWNVEKEKAAEARRTRQEAALLYRELGVAEDATYEEIVAATDAKIAKADGDIKKKVKVEITKDKILQLRLQQRMSGQIGEGSQARMERSIKADADELARKKGGVKVPKWIPKGIFVPSTDEVEQRNNILIYGGLLFFALVSPEASDPLKFVGTCLFVFRTMGRGMPKGYGRGNPPPPAMTKHYPIAFIFSVMFYVLANGLSKFVMHQFFDPTIPEALVVIKQLQFLVICPIYWWISNNIQFYKGSSQAVSEED